MSTFPRLDQSGTYIQKPSFQKTISFPKVSIDDFLRQVAEDIISILTSPPTPTTPSLEAGEPTRNALLKTATILKRTDRLPVA